MINKWENVKIEGIKLAMYVPASTGANVHVNRPFHGFVLNEPEAQKEYVFSDGTSLKTNGGDFFYLPKGSTYNVKSIQSGGCYAINFDANIDCPPFLITVGNCEKMLKSFNNAVSAWKSREPFYEMKVVKSVYDIILQSVKEQQKKYMPKSQEMLIEPAIEKIRNDFTQNGMSIAQLSELCGISEAYFRRIFVNKFGISPKEYIINLRINYSKNLLKSGQFSVSETAELCGYAEECHFSREFTKRMGINPKKYKDG